MFAFAAGVPMEDMLGGLGPANGWHSESRTSWTTPPPATPAWPRAPVRPADSAEGDRRYEAVSLSRPPGQDQTTAEADQRSSSVFFVHSQQFPSLYFIEWHYIDFVLSKAESISAAARILGIRRSTLQRKRKKAPPLR
jgi:hypothetical protein